MLVVGQVVDYKKYPHYLGQCWKSGYRAKAIHKELEKLSQDGIFEWNM